MAEEPSLVPRPFDPSVEGPGETEEGVESYSKQKKKRETNDAKTAKGLQSQKQTEKYEKGHVDRSETK